MTYFPNLLPRGPALGLAALALAALGPDATAQVTVRIGEPLAVHARGVDLRLDGTIEAAGTLDTRGSTITFTQTDGSGGISLGGGLGVQLVDPERFVGTTIHGPVQLQGSLSVSVSEDVVIEAGASFVVLTCTGGCSGAFDRVEAPFAAEVHYAGGAVTVEALEGFTTPTEGAPAAGRFALRAPFPNPFSGGVTLLMDLAASAEVRVEALDVLGRRVAVLSEGPLPAGTHEVRWNAPGLGSGTYVVRAWVDGEVTAVRRVTLAR